MRSVPKPTILFEDTHLMVIDKPAGLLSQGDAGGDPSLVDWLREYLGRPYVGLVHRLDRNTSGAIVVAKRTKSAQRLTQSLQKGDLQRTYLAVLEGHLPSAARWRHYLLKDADRNEVRVVKGPGGGAKEAVLSVTPLTPLSVDGTALTLCEFKLETGRSHQIRAQAKAEGFPLVGDRKYGPASAKVSFGRPALHSHQVSFPHPMSHEGVEFKAPLPEDMIALLTRAGIPNRW